MTSNLDVCFDFYILDAIRHNSTTSSIAGEAKHRLITTAIPLAHCMYDYLFMICMGEGRHARQHAEGTHYAELPSSDNRSAIYKKSKGFNPKENLSILRTLFSDQDWESSYGGKKWAELASFASRYENLSPIIYIDHLIDLEHNGGNIFNKTSVRHYMNFQVNWTHSELGFKNFLDWKFHSSDILVDMLIHRDKRPSSMCIHTARLLLAYWESVGVGGLVPSCYKFEPTSNNNLYRKIKLRSLFEYMPIEWGDKVLSDVQTFTNNYEAENDEEAKETAKDKYEAWKKLNENFQAHVIHLEATNLLA